MKKIELIDNLLCLPYSEGLDDDDDDDSDGSDGSIDELDGSDDEDLFEDSDAEDDEDDEDDDEDGEPKAKKHKPISSKEFNRKLKHADGKFPVQICCLNYLQIKANCYLFVLQT